ncbi:hypothetical protein [Nostoc sp. NMS8]|uniref:hypothetical protein n=1 Tax=Nostoc sp. NMS8 TaxID=2815392 RepID=UPI0025F626D8|nr:hypothetical protein [Nostoc sp. NMS8]MBN3957521.1 hypothetical protein [Nostoc sp. NMS8]
MTKQLGNTSVGTDNDDLTTKLVQPVIAKAWDDWVDDLVFYKFNDINSDIINDQLVIEWNNVHHFNNPISGDATYQTILDLNTGTQNGNIISNYTNLSL